MIFSFKRIVVCTLIPLLGSAVLHAQPTDKLRRMIDQTPVSGVSLKKSGANLEVKMDVDFSKVDVGGNKAFYILPVITKDEHEAELPSLGLMSRGRFINNSRWGGYFLSIL